jgi:hypothetical protein
VGGLISSKKTFSCWAFIAAAKTLEVGVVQLDDCSRDL